MFSIMRYKPKIKSKMGQRSQIFIRTLNPVHVNKGYESGLNAEDKERYELIKDQLGTKKYTTVAFHHQWLYGQTAVGNVYQFLKFLKNVNKHSSPFNESWISSYVYPHDDIKECWINVIKSIMTIQHNEISAGVKRCGVERFLYLNEEDSEFKDRYDIGDNNDGCTIIDTVTGKYCFISFHGFREEPLPLYTPVSAADYYKVYYPVFEGQEMTPEFAEFWAGEGKSLEELLHKKEWYEKIKELFKEYKVMTLGEVKKMFPKVYEEVDPKDVGRIPKED